ncbi:alpha/beta fold hydrolase [Actinomadura macrotermitis]|uniref:Monoacylglycerol lipase n=1 Tax=Actinomadura macrotermitis TaxID=2585200 RepID=A0A7K0BND8_9ACTN|nr:alpha/beta fold hydrolase [Actinomadura macrotermitis]MQY02695.1 Monoacylglycerol lipase [Actinomadura macrotermitis]
MPFFDGAAGRVYYRSWTAAQPRAGLVFLHGFGEHSGLYHRLAAALNHRDISVWALDEVGHGLSEGRRGHVPSLDPLVTNARALTEIAAADGLPLLLAGHSLGGTAAALAAVRDPGPYAGLVLSGTPLGHLDWLDELPEDGGVDLDPAALSADPAYLDALENDPLAFTEAEAVFPGDALGAAWKEIGPRFAELTLPILFVHGSADVIAPIEGNETWAVRLDNAELARFEGARHDVLNETVHREVAAAIADFTLKAAAA